MSEAAPRWAGHATREGTAQYAAATQQGFKPAQGHFREHPVQYSGVDGVLPSSLSLSSIGIGTYLGEQDEATDEAVSNAVVHAVAEGINVIDTAPNYRGGRAEAAVGAALHTLRMTGGAERAGLFVSTKAGFVSHSILARLQGKGMILGTDVVGGRHCLHPAVLRASLARSLEALRLESVDVLFIHNPAEEQLRTLGLFDLMRRLREAFEACETERKAGRLRAYGLATWTCFGLPPDNPGHLSLSSVVETAREVGGEDHGFRYIMLPVNAHMPEAWTEKWQQVEVKGEGDDDARVGYATILDAARMLGVGVFGSGPLMEGQLVSTPQMAATLDELPELEGVQGVAPKLLQIARSTPGLLSVLVGMKTPANVEADTALVPAPPLTPEAFKTVVERLPQLLTRRLSEGF